MPFGRDLSQTCRLPAIELPQASPPDPITPNIRSQGMRLPTNVGIGATRTSNNARTCDMHISP
jgi:hypothetical protein